ncbi:MAG TPA: hypothetical protein VK843_03240 [Planctomycetota bacterium]|nr:hypothetical protein [Planctomycetota bacterium]
MERKQELTSARRATRESRWRDAAALWREILQHADANSREACVETARALIELHDPAGAQRMVDLGLRTFADDSGLHELKARALEEQGLEHAAETAYEHALQLAPNDDRIVFALANLRHELGLNMAALQLLEPRLTSGKASAREFELAGWIYRSLHRQSQAYVSFDRAFALAPPSLAQLLSAASMYADESVRRKDARAADFSARWANQALAIDPQATAAHMILGMLAEDAQRDAQAAESYRRAVETDPASVEALSALAAVQQRRGELEDSKALAQRALALEKDPAKRAELEKLANPPAPGGG